MTEQQTDKSTPRPWDVFRLDEGNWVVCEEGEPPHGIFGEKQDADLTVEAVNAYDPAREEKIQALVEAAKAAVINWDQAGAGQGVVIDTLRTALEAMEKAG